MDQSTRMAGIRGQVHISSDETLSELSLDQLVLVVHGGYIVRRSRLRGSSLAESESKLCTQVMQSV